MSETDRKLPDRTSLSRQIWSVRYAIDRIFKKKPLPISQREQDQIIADLYAAINTLEEKAK